MRFHLLKSTLKRQARLYSAGKPPAKPIHPEWEKLVKKELKGREASQLLWNTAEVRETIVSPHLLTCEGYHCETSLHKSRHRGCR
jgi:hypothetical protein